MAQERTCETPWCGAAVGPRRRFCDDCTPGKTPNPQAARGPRCVVCAGRLYHADGPRYCLSCANHEGDAEGRRYDQYHGFLAADDV